MIRGFDVVHEKRDCVLFADEKAFYIAELHHKLTKAQTDQLRRGECTVEQMQDLGISGTAIARSDIRGIAAEGYDRADELIFHLQNKKKIAVLFSRQYDKEDADAFFKGIPRFQKARGRHTKVGRRHKDWHVREQNPAVRKRLEPVDLALKWASALTIVGFLIKPQWITLWSVLSILWVLAGLVLLFFFEPYVTLLDDKEFRKAGYQAEVISLTLLPWLPFGIITLMLMDRYAFFDMGLVLVWGITAGLVLAFLMWLFLREIHENGMLAVTVAFFCCVLCMGLVMHGNHLLAREEMVQQQVQVVDKYRSGGRNKDYYLTVELSDGRTLKIDVGRTAYEAYEIGDDVTVRTRTGAFGLEYGMFVYTE